VVLPIRETANSLNRRITDLLEILPDLTNHFEVVVVDAGSSDATGEIAHELSREYPQVRVVHTTSEPADDALMQLAVDRTDGDIVVVFDRDAPIRPNQLREMWQLRKDQQLIMARSNRTNRGSLIDRLRTWADGLPQEVDESAHAAGFQLLRRKTLKELPAASESANAPQRPTAPRDKAFQPQPAFSRRHSTPPKTVN
jgi:glycosyltransferase involved in cell wall biosynthesis